MKPLRLLLLAVSVAALATACGGGLSSSDAAKAGGTKVPKWRVDALLAQAKANYEQQGRPFPKPGSVEYGIFKERATAFLVVGAMYADKAKRDGITVGDKEVNAALQQRLKSFGATVARQQEAMRAQGVTLDELRAEVKQALIQQRVQAKVYSTVHVTQADLEAYYRKNESKYSTSARRLVREIVVSSKQLANRLAVQLHSGANFAELVRKYSNDAGTRANGGRLTIVKGQASADIDAVVFSLKTGQISRPLTSGDRQTRIFQALAPTKAAQVTPLSEISDVIRNDVTDAKRQAALAAWQLDVKKNYCGHKVEYAKGYVPSAQDDPCGQNRITPTG